MDEPTKAVDWILRKEVVEVLRQMKEEMKCSMLLITHDFGAASRLADRIGVMYCGQIVEIGETQQILKYPQHPYTKGLIGAMPSRGFQVMEGFMPSFPMCRRAAGLKPRGSRRRDVCARKVPGNVQRRRRQSGALFSLPTGRIKGGWLSCLKFDI